MNEDFRFCPRCGAALTPHTVGGQQRPACRACGFIHFCDPKVAVVAFVVHQGSVLLTQRTVAPGKGDWSLPGGYMDAGEMPEQALRRELREEIALEVADVELWTILAMPGGRGIVIVYKTTPLPGDWRVLRCDDDVSAAGWFTPSTLPNNLAFESTQRLIEEWVNGAMKYTPNGHSL